MRERCLALSPRIWERAASFEINRALAHVVDVLDEINAYLERTAPWKQAKAGDTNHVETILYHASDALRLVSVLLQPVMPERMAELWRRLGWRPPVALQNGLKWGLLQRGPR